MPSKPRPVPPTTSVSALLERYPAFLLDAFGVLVDSRGPLPGAARLIERLRAEHKRFVVVTNDASRLPETTARRFASFGLDVPAERILTSGSLLAPYFARHRLAGARCLVLGPKDSVRYVEAAGGVPVEADAGAAYDACVVCDDAGYPFLDTLDIALSALYRHFDRGDSPHLILPNPDLIYPKTEGEYGFTSGAVAMLLEAALARRYPEARPSFVRLGKPHPPMFEEARRLAGTDRLVMIGDQMETDITGALDAGIDAVLLETGVTRWRHRGDQDGERTPTSILPGLDQE